MSKLTKNQDKFGSADSNDSTYTIIRFAIGKPNKTIKTGLTLEEAQKHCSSEDTHGEGWFDGYTED